MFLGIHPDSFCAAMFEAQLAMGRKNSFNLAMEKSSKVFGTSWGCPLGNSRFREKLMLTSVN
jgi:hypothetical protein